MVRTSYIRGPAYVTFSGRSFITKDSVRVSYDMGIFRPESELYGPLTARVGERVSEVSFTPIGTLIDTDIRLLCPLSGYADFVGGSIFGESASAGVAIPSGGIWADGSRAGSHLVIIGRDGETLTFHTAAVNKMPDITFSATKTLLGGVSFTVLGTGVTGVSGWNDDWTTAATAAWSNPSVDLNPYTQPYAVNVSGYPGLNEIQTQYGVTVSFGTSTDRHEVDNYGTNDLTWSNLEVTARFTPVSLSSAQIHTLLLNKMQSTGGSLRGGVVPGSAAAGKALIITGVGGGGTRIVFTMANPAITDVGLEFSQKSPRVSDMQLAFSRFSSTDIPFTLVGSAAT